MTKEKEELNIQVKAMEMYSAISDIVDHLGSTEKYIEEGSRLRDVESIREAVYTILSDSGVRDLF